MLLCPLPLRKINRPGSAEVGASPQISVVKEHVLKQMLCIQPDVNWRESACIADFVCQPSSSPKALLMQVNFPLVLDCYEFCSDEYKKELDLPRQAYHQVEDKKAGIEKLKKEQARKEQEAKEQASSKSSKKRPLPKVSCPSEPLSTHHDHF